MRKCEYCGKEYVENKGILPNLPDFMKEAIKYIPSCDCLEKKKQEQFAELSRQYEEEGKRNRVKKYKDISIIDKKFYESKFENAENIPVINLLKKYSEKFKSIGTAPAGLFLYGSVGTGKTYAASCLANDLMTNGKTVLFMSFALYLIKIREGFKNYSEETNIESEILKHVKTCDLLIIDDLGIENVKEFAAEKLFTLLDTRYRTKKPFVITTNLSIEAIKEKFGERICDRINGSTYKYECKGESRRKINEKEFAEWLMA